MYYSIKTALENGKAVKTSFEGERVSALHAGIIQHHQHSIEYPLAVSTTVFESKYDTMAGQEKVAVFGRISAVEILPPKR